MEQGTHYTFFQTAHLQSIVDNVVVPGLRIRESDVEDFEDNPLECVQIFLCAIVLRSWFTDDENFRRKKLAVWSSF